MMPTQAFARVSGHTALLQTGRSAGITAAILAVGLACAGDEPAAVPDAAGRIMPIAEFKALDPQTLRGGPPVRIRGVAVWVDNHSRAVVQDDTAMVFCHMPEGGGRMDMLDERIKPGTEVEIAGIGERGSFGPRLRIVTATALGQRPLPSPRDVDAAFIDGANDIELVRLTGVVLGQEAKEEAVHLRMEAGGRCFLADVPRGAIAGEPGDLVDAVVSVAGIAWPQANPRGERLTIRMECLRPEWFRIVEPPAAAPFDSPKVGLDAIARFAPRQRLGRIVQTEGVVIHAEPGRAIYLQDGDSGLTVRTDSSETFEAGDHVAVAGFLDRGGPVVGLKNALVQKLGTSPAPAPATVEPDEIVAKNMRAWKSTTIDEGDHIGCLIRHPATLVEKRTTEDGGELLLRAGRSIVPAQLGKEAFARLATLEPGSELDVTGIVTPGWRRESGAVPDRIGLVVRTADDVRLVRPPSWWTPTRLLAALATVAAVLVGAVAWVLLLRRQVTKQATRLAGEIRKGHEAAIGFRAALAERSRLANNLHDTLLQGLAGAVLQLDACRFSLSGGQPKLAEGQLEKSKRMVQHAANDLRNSVWALRVAPLEGRTLAESLQTVADHLACVEAPRITLRTEGAVMDLPEFVAGNLLLVAQEAIRNALHHAGAKTVDVRAMFEPAAQRVTLIVRDDGRGFDPARTAGPEQGHFGLQVMRERMEGMGGGLAIDTAPSRGATVTATIMLDE